MKKLLFVFLTGFLVAFVASDVQADTERYGFESGSQGWVASDYQYGQAITSVEQSSDKSKAGTYSLKMNADLVGGSSTNADGEAYVDMRYNPPSGVYAPADLQGQTVTAYIYCPTGSRGDNSKPNGIQIFAKDENWNSIYSSWVNIVENTWIKLTMLVNSAGSFDATNVIVVGFKIGAGTGSTATYEGPIYMDVVSFDVGTPPQPSSENQRYDFETGVQGWTDSDYEYGQAVTSVEQSSTEAALGDYSLKLNTDLIGSDTYKSEGEAYVDMRYYPPSGVSTPVNLNGVEVTAWVYCPSGSRGDPDNPNGIQIFVKDENWKAEYSTWSNIFEEVWFKVTLIPSTTAPIDGYMDEDFDPTNIISVGVKIGSGSGSTATYNGPIYMDVYAFPQPGVPLSDYTYNFNDPGDLDVIPHWDVDPGWGAEAWDSVYLEDDALTADADFDTSSDPTRKGYVHILYTPPIYLSNKDDHTIRAEIKFDPQPGAFDFAGTLWVYDKEGEAWYQNDYKSIGGGVGWNVLTFDLDDNTAYDPDLPGGETMPLGQIVKVGIQLYANEDYTGKVYFDNITVGGEEITSNYPQNNTGLVTTSGVKFMLNGDPFYFAGANAEYLFEKSVPIEEEVLDASEDMNLTVVRTWAFGEGESASFQPERGKWNKSAFDHLDRLIAYAGVKGIRLIMPLVDNWGHYGGMYKYMDWVLEEYPESIPEYDDNGNYIDTENKNDAYHDQFYVNPYCKQWYKDYVTYLLNRTNSITGVKYKDDPNIMAWEVFNEPRCKSDVSGKRIHDWIIEMSAFVKDIDSNHLVGSGEEGSYIMSKSQADNIDWQDFPQNYWEYGCNWTVWNEQTQDYDNWGSNGADFLSDHKSTATTVYWQEYIGEKGESSVESEERAGCPDIDYCSFRTYIDYHEFNLFRTDPYDQALEWLEQHMDDAVNVIGKPVVMEEFGIHTVGYIYWGGFGETKFHRYPAYTYADRRSIFSKYYDYIYSNEIGGSLFWNLGYDGMREFLFDGCEDLDHDEYATWQIDANSDATAISVSSSYFTEGDNSLKCDYSYTQEVGKAYYDLPNLSEKWEVTSENPPESGAINMAKFMFDVYNAGDVEYVDLAVCTGNSWTWHESEMQAVTSGWNTITVDLASETWKSAASGWNYTGDIADLDDVRKIAIGLFGYSGTASVYVDNIRIFEDDGFVIYPDDQITDIISDYAESMSGKGEGISSNLRMWRYSLGRTSDYPNGPQTFPLSLKWTQDGHDYHDPVIADGVVYIPYMAYMKAYDAETGELLWSWTSQEGGWMYEPAVGNNGKLYFANRYYSGGNYVKIYCLDAETGEEEWGYDTGENASHHGIPVVYKGLVYIGCYNGVVYALDADDGSLEWSYSTGSRIETSPAVGYNKVYIPSVSRLYALDAETGEEEWNTTVGNWNQSSPAVALGNVYLASNNGRVYAFDADTGDYVWDYYTGQWVYGNYSSPAVVDNTVYIGSGDDINKVFALDAETGEFKWSYTTDGSTFLSSPAVSNGTVYITTRNNKIYALDSDAGTLKWSYTFGGSWDSNESSPAIYNGKVYVTGLTADNYRKLHCFEEQE